MSAGDATARAPGRILFVAANPSIDRLYELERLAAGEIHRPLAVVAVAGGKGLNAARAAATLGGRVTALALIGGASGDWIAAELARLAIHARLARTTAETRTCVSILDRSTGSLTEVYERGAAIDAGAWDALEALIATELSKPDVAAIAVSGSLPAGAPVDGFARIARLAATAAEPVAVLADTYGPALDALLAAGPAYVKVNGREAGEATGVDVRDGASAAVAAGRLRDRGAGAALISLGMDGAVLATADARLQLVPPDLPGAYPVGSGDAVLAGLAVGLGLGWPVVEAAGLGLAAGVANAQLPGAGVLDPTAIDTLRERVTVRPI